MTDASHQIHFWRRALNVHAHLSSDALSAVGFRSMTTIYEWLSRKLMRVAICLFAGGFLADPIGALPSHIALPLYFLSLLAYLARRDLRSHVAALGLERTIHANRIVTATAAVPRAVETPFGHAATWPTAAQPIYTFPASTPAAAPGGTKVVSIDDHVASLLDRVDQKLKRISDE